MRRQSCVSATVMPELPHVLPRITSFSSVDDYIRHTRTPPTRMPSSSPKNTTPQTAASHHHICCDLCQLGVSFHVSISCLFFARLLHFPGSAPPFPHTLPQRSMHSISAGVQMSYSHESKIMSVEIHSQSTQCSYHMGGSNDRSLRSLG